MQSKTAWNWIEGKIRWRGFCRMISTCVRALLFLLSFDSSCVISHETTPSVLRVSWDTLQACTRLQERNIGQPCSVNINCRDVIHQRKCHGKRRTKGSRERRTHRLRRLFKLDCFYYFLPLLFAWYSVVSFCSFLSTARETTGFKSLTVVYQ